MKQIALRASRVALTFVTIAFTTLPCARGADATPSTAQPAVQKTTHLYATKEGQELKLDLIIDSALPVPAKRPVIIFSFGGGWEGGSRGDKSLAPAFEQFTSWGYAVAAIDYRLGIRISKQRKEFTKENGTAMYLRAFEWGVEDIFDATSFILKQDNIDKDQIVLMGGSSGATNSLVAEFHSANGTDLAKAHLPAGFRYAGVISMAGAFWLRADTPLTFKNRPAPILFFHGAKDQLVTYDEIQGAFSGYGPMAYFRKLPGPDFPKWFVDYPQGDHIIAGLPMMDSTSEMKIFLQKFVKERKEISVHTIEEAKIPKTFFNAGKLLSKPSK